MSRGTDNAAKGINAAAAVANAVPGWGQVAGAALAVIGGLVKLFGNIDGPRKKKKRRRKQAHQRMVGHNQQLGANAAAASTGAGGQLNTGFGNMPQNVVSSQPATPMYNPGASNHNVASQQRLPGTGQNNG